VAFVQDTFTRGNTITLTSHTGEIGATWVLHTSYSQTFSVNGSIGKCYRDGTSKALAYASGTELFTTGWLNWKHFGYGVIVLAALVLIPISGTALRNLEAIERGAPDPAALNRQIRRHMNFAMPVVFLVWILIIVLSILSLLNLKTPEGQEYIFRKTAGLTI